MKRDNVAVVREDRNRSLAEPGSALRVVEVDSQTDPRWESLVTTLSDGLIYHHPAWLRVLEEAYGYKPVNLACEDADGELQGILPLYYMRRPFTGRCFVSLPRTPQAGPLARDERTMAILLQGAVERVRKEPGTCLQLKVFSNALDGLVGSVVSAPWSVTYRMKLPERLELLRFGNSRNHSRIRWAINKATRLGVEVHPAQTERELRAWYSLYLDTMRRLAVPPRPYHFFEVAWTQLQPRGLMRLLLAERYESGRSKLLAGSLFLTFGQTFFYAFTGWSREDLLLRPNDVVQWRAIHDACAEGYRYYDFGEVDRDDQGLADFKSKWGAEPVWLYRYYYPAPRELETGILESSSRIRQFAGAVWRRLPIKATVLLSNWVHYYF
jgi:CelD/BcsL family acetyltransferase involved in cellulose biosynthesis